MKTLSQGDGFVAISDRSIICIVLLLFFWSTTTLVISSTYSPFLLLSSSLPLSSSLVVVVVVFVCSVREEIHHRNHSRKHRSVDVGITSDGSKEIVSKEADPDEMPRKKPFSGKKKKEQLKEKRRKRANRNKNSQDSVANDTEGTSQTKQESVCENSSSTSSVKLVTSFGGNDVRNVDNRLATMMIREDDEKVRKRRLQGSVPVDTSKQGTFPKAVHTPLKQILYHPRRPQWKSNLTAVEVEANEKIQFDNWCSAIHSSYEQGQITPFEHNLEVWRQLWRVVEQSDVLLLTCDCRNPLFHISQSLVDECLLLRKPVIIVLTKTDLVPVQHVHQWIAFLKHLYPFVNVFPFSSRGTLSENELNKLNGGVTSRRKVLKKKPNVQQATKS